MRSEEEDLVEAVAETIRIGEESGVRINTSHLKASGKLNWGLMKPALKLMKEARARGVEMTADMYPYDKSATTPLQIIFLVPPDMAPFPEMEKKMADPDLPAAKRAELYRRYPEELAAALKDPARREKIRDLTEKGDPDKVNWVAKGGWYNFTIMDSKKHPELIGRMFCDLAEEQGREEFDIAADLFVEEGNGAVISLSAMSEEDVRLALRQEFVMISSDGSAVPYKKGGAHPRNYGSNARVLRRYVREEGLLSLANAVRKMTSLPARLLRLKQRGLLLEGWAADLVIFDPGTVRDNATYLDPHQYCTGVSTVILNGEPVIEKGTANGKLNGRVLLLTENR
jgi:N-acyl-D-amino-acid deacylase